MKIIKKLLLGVMACGVEQAALENFGRQMRLLLRPFDFDFRVELFVDTFEKLRNLGALAHEYDAVIFHKERVGFGAARSMILKEAQTHQADFLVIVDGDGQYDEVGLTPVLENLAQGAFDIVFPDRQQRHLPLADNSNQNRLIAEYFENYVIANMARRPEYRWLDLQPGAFGLKSSAVDAVASKVKSRDFCWELEFSYNLLKSDLRIGTVPVKVKTQSMTLFKGSDLKAVLDYLFAAFGNHEVMAQLSRFVNEDKVKQDFPPGEVEELRTKLCLWE